MTSLNGMEIMETPAADFTAVLEKVVEHLFGPWVSQASFGVVTWADWYVMLALLLGVVLCQGLVVLWLRRQKNSAGPGASIALWQPRWLAAVGRPVYLAIWVYGLYLMATPLVLKCSRTAGFQPLPHWLDNLADSGLFGALIWLFYRLTRVLEAWLAVLARKTKTKLDDLLVPLLGRSLRVMIPVLGVIFSLPLLGLPPKFAGVLGHGSSLLIIGTVAWLLFQAIGFGEKWVLASYDVSSADNLQARKVYTQVHVFGTVLQVVVSIFTAGSILMLFDEVRRFGTSLLASAGILGVIAGFAAQKTIASLFAGFQLALTQPIRLDDVVIVAGEWGRIEEITLTYVVVRLWDERRMVVPLTWFIEQPFQNWTRISAGLTGSVLLWVDYSLPVEKIREVVKKIVESSALWDRRFWNLQVSDATEKSIQLRVLATAADASKAWDLRCEIREKLIAVIQKEYPQGLPRLRAGLAGSDGRPTEAGGDLKP